MAAPKWFRSEITRRELTDGTLTVIARLDVQGEGGGGSVRPVVWLETEPGALPETATDANAPLLELAQAQDDLDPPRRVIVRSAGRYECNLLVYEGRVGDSYAVRRDYRACHVNADGKQVSPWTPVTTLGDSSVGTAPVTLPPPAPADDGIDPRKLLAPTWVSATASKQRISSTEYAVVVELKLDPPHPDRSAFEVVEVAHGHPIEEALAVEAAEGVVGPQTLVPPRRFVVRYAHPYHLKVLAHIVTDGEPPSEQPLSERRDYYVRRIENELTGIYGAWSTVRTLAVEWP